MKRLTLFIAIYLSCWSACHAGTASLEISADTAVFFALLDTPSQPPNEPEDEMGLGSAVGGVFDLGDTVDEAREAIADASRIMAKVESTLDAYRLQGVTIRIEPPRQPRRETPADSLGGGSRQPAEREDMDVRQEAVAFPGCAGFSCPLPQQSQRSARSGRWIQTPAILPRNRRWVWVPE